MNLRQSTPHLAIDKTRRAALVNVPSSGVLTSKEMLKPISIQLSSINLAKDFTLVLTEK
jgi:hypothetical protein